MPPFLLNGSAVNTEFASCAMHVTELGVEEKENTPLYVACVFAAPKRKFKKNQIKRENINETACSKNHIKMPGNSPTIFV